MPNEDALMAKLNNIADILETITSGHVRQLVNRPRLNDVATGCTADCGCKGGYCECNASVTKNERFGSISYPEFLQMREARMRELQAELATLESPKFLEK